MKLPRFLKAREDFAALENGNGEAGTQITDGEDKEKACEGRVGEF